MLDEVSVEVDELVLELELVLDSFDVSLDSSSFTTTGALGALGSYTSAGFTLALLGLELVSTQIFME